MSRYYFHIDYGGYSPDMEGVEIASMSAAQTEGLRLLSELLRDQTDSFWAKPEITVTVTDDVGLTLWTLAVSGTAAPAVSGMKSKNC